MRPNLSIFAIVLNVLVAVVASRLVGDAFFGDSLVLVTLFGAVAAAVYFGGYRAGILVAASGYVAADFLFLEPHGIFDLPTAKDVVQLGTYIVSCAMIVGTGEALRRARDDASDITDRKRLAAERHKFVTLVENSVDFIGMCDPAGVPFYINPAGLQMAGLRNMEQARRTRICDFFHPQDQPKVIELFSAAIEHGHAETVVRFRNFHTGATRWIGYKAINLTDESGRRVGFATISQDISERRRLEGNAAYLRMRAPG